MKILLFNLGSISHRIKSWDVEGYKNLFEHDIILWGPIPDPEFIFNGKNIPILRILEPTCIQDIFDRLPQGWIPDIVTCDTSVLIYVPDIHLCPAKTILFTRDAWADTIFNRKLIELFDFTCHSVIDFYSYGKFDCQMLPLAGYPVSLPEPDLQLPGFEDRSIDVIAIANYNEGFYHDRYKVFYELAQNNRENLNIKYFSGLERKEIHEFYRRSKIVVDWAHTLSNRSYEAALNGCLLFSHEDNTTMSSFWKPGKEYVTYNQENLYERLLFYIKNPGQANEIIQNSSEKIKTLPVGFGQYTFANINLALSSYTDIKARINRGSSLTPSDLAFRTSTPFAYNYRYETRFPSNWEDLYFKRIDNAINLATDFDDQIRPLIEAARIAFLSGRFNSCSEYLGKLETLIPDYGWIYYLRGRISYAQKDFEKALEYLKKAIEFATELPDTVREFILPFIEKDLNCDGRRITDYLWQSVYNHNNEFQVTALLHLSAGLKGDIYKDLNEREKALKEFSRAIDYLAAPDYIIKAAPLLINSHKFSKLLEICERGIADSPFENNIVLYQAFALIKLGKRKEAYKVLKMHGKAIKSFPGTRKIKYLQKLVTFPAIAGFISRKAGTMAIEILINKLKK